MGTLGSDVVGTLGSDVLGTLYHIDVNRDRAVAVGRCGSVPGTYYHNVWVGRS